MPADKPTVSDSRLLPQQSETGQEHLIASEEAYFQPGPLLTKATLSLAHGGTMFIAVIALITMAIGHTEHVETLLYPATFALLLPLAAIAAHYQLAPLPTRPDFSALIAGGNLAALSTTLLLGRLLSEIGGASALRVVFLLGAALIALGNLVTTKFIRLRARSVRLPWFASAIPAALVVGPLLLFVPHDSLTPLHLSASIELGVVIALILMAASAVRVRRSITVALDVIVALVLIPLLTCDFNQYHASLRFDQDFYVGPANAILHGSPMLVDTFAQYGVGVMYFLAGIFEVIPIGYGSFQLVNGLLTALELVLVYVVLRIGCRSQLYAVVGTTVCLVANVLTGFGPHVRYASAGPLRFGLPWVLITLAVLAAKTPGRRRALDASMLALVGVSAIWSFETFLYTIGAYLAVVALELVLQDGPGRERAARAGRQFGLLASVIVASHVVFAVATRVFGGQWPDWGGYLAYVRLYGWNGRGTLLIDPWSLGYLIAALYFVSTVGLVFVALEQREFAAAKRVELTAIATTTAFGILSYTYFLGRSHPNNLHHIAPAAIVLSALWVSLLARHTPVVHRTARFAVLAFVGWAAAAVIVQQPQETRASLLRSPLRQIVQLNPRLSARAHALIDWRQEPVDQPAIESEQLLDRFAPGRSRVAVVVRADLQTEALIRAHRGNLLPIAVPNQDAWLPERSLSLVEKRLSRLGPGSVVLTEQDYLDKPPHYRYRGAAGNADELEVVVLSEIRRLFRYRVAATTPDGLVLLILEAKRV
ncbi:MAG: hypothetical protein ABSB96_02440 [Gaiellaceae bacterium]